MRVFRPVSRASCPSVESQKLANIISTIPAILCHRSVWLNIHPAPIPRNIERMVIVLGCTPRRAQSSAKARPMGRVKYMSSHSSVSADLNEARSNSLKLFSITLFFQYEIFCFLYVRGMVDVENFGEWPCL